ncbi:hypothetical protein B0T22DRAFT_476049 [Podospora appendiculata]|uniref:FAD-binding PCMH-type domain-containing protein n=1 Tax=Podospora appendiculata TaxID=314037 RepID=A0AAE1CG21_9PEZI|nr:hypothetical protein B0T22DRAFT_476049 [Podospora appendiculata]
MPPQPGSAGPAAETLADFLNAAADLLGEKNVSRDSQHSASHNYASQDSYGDDPAAVVRPKTVEDVQQLVRLANTFKVSLWAISRGKNLGYGGSGPVVKGAIVLDLQRMNNIIEVNEEYGYAIVEPGVSFFNLYEEIQRQGLNLWPSVPAIGWGSAMGNTLDRGFGYTPNGEHSQSQCGMEVVLPNGELLRTGSGAMRITRPFPCIREALAHAWTVSFSNPTSVTNLLTIPRRLHQTRHPHHAGPRSPYATVEVDVPLESDPVPLICTLSDLMRRSIILNSPSIANIFRIALTSQLPAVFAKIVPHMYSNSCVPARVLSDIQTEHKWGYWRAYFSLYGSVEMLPALKQTVARTFVPIPGAQIAYKLSLPGTPGAFISAARDIISEEIPHSGIPTIRAARHRRLARRRGKRQGRTRTRASRRAVIPPSGCELYASYLTARQRTTDAKFDFFADFHVYPRYVVGIALVIYNAEEDEERRMQSWYEDLISDAAKQGWVEYRTHVQYMDRVAAKLDFNDGAFGKVTRLLKDTLDPNGVLAPGKSGVWNSARVGYGGMGEVTVPV